MEPPPLTPEFLLGDPTIRAALRKTWLDSRPSLEGGHEEGGFVVQDSSGQFGVIRWAMGLRNTIQVPPHPECRVEGQDIVFSFHTHPNTGSDYLQEPSETDKRAVSHDPDLKGKSYLGELVISQETIYLITPSGAVRSLVLTEAVVE